MFIGIIKKLAWWIKREWIQKSGGREWNFIILHHSATRDDGNADDWEAIRRYHKSYAVNGNIVSEQEWHRIKKYAAEHNKNHHFKRPWDDIGYHFGIEKDDGKLVVKQGRPLSDTGAHAYMPGNNFYNRYGIGICIVGDYDTDPPDTERWNMTIWLIRQLMLLYDIPARYVLGHRELYVRENRPPIKTCPGSAIDMDKLRAEL